MTETTIPMTADAIAVLRDELRQLRTEGRREVAEELHEAFGSELDRDIDVVPALEAVKERQAVLEGRIARLEWILGRATPIDEAAIRTQAVVQPGSTVVLERDNGRASVYRVVSSVESDPAHGKISDRSPIGAALVGKRAGDSVTVKVPAGVRQLRIVEVR